MLQISANHFCSQQRSSRDQIYTWIKQKHSKTYATMFLKTVDIRQRRTEEQEAKQSFQLPQLTTLGAFPGHGTRGRNSGITQWMLWSEETRAEGQRELMYLEFAKQIRVERAAYRANSKESYRVFSSVWIIPFMWRNWVWRKKYLTSLEDNVLVTHRTRKSDYSHLSGWNTT